MADFRVELDGEDVLRTDRCDLARAAPGENPKARGRLDQVISVRHPDVQLVRESAQQRAVVDVWLKANDLRPVLPFPGWLDPPVQRRAKQVHAVANAQNGQAGFEDVAG